MPAMSARTFLFPILMAGTVMGCQPAWVQNGRPDRPLAAAQADCDVDASHGFFGAGISGFMNQRAYIDRCIASHGYRQVDPRSVPASKPS
jgi:hypothetical protein